MPGDDATVAVVVVLAALAALAAAGRAWGTEEERGNGTAAGRRVEVTYDGRALILDGARRMLFSGDMHYPRSTPEVHNVAVAGSIISCSCTQACQRALRIVVICEVHLVCIQISLSPKSELDLRSSALPASAP